MSNSAFDERFPDAPADGGADVGPGAGVSAVDVDAELAALADDDADSGREPSNAVNPRMPMVTGGMGSMAAASAGHAVTTAQNKGAASWQRRRPSVSGSAGAGTSFAPRPRRRRSRDPSQPGLGAVGRMG